MCNEINTLFIHKLHDVHTQTKCLVDNGVLVLYYVAMHAYICLAVSFLEIHYSQNILYSN